MRLSVFVEGLERRYAVHVPKDRDRSAPFPVVMIFHGGGSTADFMMRMTSWVDKANENGFLAVFPEGMSLDPSEPADFARNPQFWNDGTGREHVGERNINDIGFVEACLDDLAARFPVDPEQIFATGFSNGAFMVSRLGMELPQRIAAIAPVAGMYLHREGRPSPHVSVLCIAGTEDPLSPLRDGEVTWPWGGKELQPGVLDSVRKWAEMAGCVTCPGIVAERQGIKVISYGSQGGDTEVILYTVEGMGHTWPGARVWLPEAIFGKTTDKICACDIIWDFFRHHKRNGYAELNTFSCVDDITRLMEKQRAPR
jgi:polyhydroxybutyrate depolymerase